MFLSRFVSIGWVFLLLLTAQGAAGQETPFDPHIPGFHVTGIVRGEKAIVEINKLHGMRIDVVAGVIVHYKGSTGRKATVWASEARSEDKAQQQIDVMMAKMRGNPRSPFKGYRAWKQAKRPVIGFEGLGQSHRVFRVGSWVYWLSGQAPGIDQIVMHICSR